MRLIFGLLHLFLLSNVLLAQTDNYKSLDGADKVIDPLRSNCLTNSPILSTQLDGRTEEWRRCSYSNNRELFIITSSDERTDYFELFLTIDNALVYAEESIISYSQRPDNGTPWTCQYLLADRNVVDYISLGHGETEDENWQPESIFEQWNARLATYGTLQK
ncbi:MAG: hypothetical protein RIB71_19280 [Imperialibacter sp.]|uniref:hypothetical protein n=1 Tax=Imperialibacter sp. TaxID=2038411 RepID=UPI0032EFBE29